MHFGRDLQLKEQAKSERKNRIAQERSQNLRSNEHLVLLFDTIVDTFYDFMKNSKKRQLRMSGFKYCPTPGCSADKATGNLESSGIGEAMMRKLGFANRLSPTGGRREFKEWIATYRLAEGVAESWIGRQQLKQINYAKLPTLHATLWVDRIHKRYNAAGWDAFHNKTMESLEKKDNGDDNARCGVNTSNMDIVDLYDRIVAEDSSSVAELQFLSLIRKIKIPEGYSVFPVVDVSLSMQGIPMKAAIMLGLLLAYAQEEHLFMTFHTNPDVYCLPPLFGDERYLIKDIIISMHSKPWGGRTDFMKSMLLIRKELRRRKAEDPNANVKKPVLVVGTDMEFDEATQEGAIQYESNLDALERLYAAAGIEMPILVLWNMRGGISSAAAQPSRRNVVMLSGFNADLLQDFFGMLERGAFEDARAGDAVPAAPPAAEQQPSLQGAEQDAGDEGEMRHEKMKKPELSTDAFIQMLLNSDMYQRLT